MHEPTFDEILIKLRWQILSLKCDRAADTFLRALWRYDASLKRKAGFRPDQPRDGHGQWAPGNGGDLIRVGANGRTIIQARVGRRVLAATPGQVDRLAYAEAYARQTIDLVRQYEPAWRPNPSLSDPNSIEGAIRTAEAEAVEAEARLAELFRPRPGSPNGGPPLDPLPPSTPLPPICIQTYRQITGMPDIFDRLARAKSEGTVAYAEIDGKPVFGTNSNAPGYTVADETAARDMRARLSEAYPEVMNTGHPGRMPNDGLFHAEGNLLIRAAERSGGSLAGQTIEIRVDRELCRSCDKVLPLIGLQLGNPRVRLRDSEGNVDTMFNGQWER